MSISYSTQVDTARHHLRRQDPILRKVIEAVGPCTLRLERNRFRALVRSIIAQQISTKAAQSIFERLQAALMTDELRPTAILEATPEALRGAGLSSNKARALLDLADKVHSGAVPLERLQRWSDEKVIEALLPVRGIGRWTAEMFLIFSLGRLDVLPVADLGLRAGVRRHYGLAELPSKDELVKLAESWQPYRSIGTWYLWRSGGFVPQSTAQPKKTVRSLTPLNGPKGAERPLRDGGSGGTIP